jgi:putative transposase
VGKNAPEDANQGEEPMARKRYTTDLTDAQWERVRPVLEEYHPREHRNREHSLREILDALFYKLRTGCQWRNLPGDLPPYSTVSDYFHRWRKNGLLERLHATLRAEVRAQAGREEQPSAGSLDSQSAKSTEKGGSQARLGSMEPSG